MLSTVLIRLSLGYVVLFLVAVVVLGATGVLDGTTLLAVTLALAGGLVLSATLLALAFRHLTAIAAAVRSIGRGDLQRRVEASPASGVGELAAVVNQMSQSLEDLVAGASQERDRLTAALNSDVDPLLAVDREGRVAFANASAAGLFGRSSDEMVGSPLAFIVANEQVVKAARTSREEGRRVATAIEGVDQQYLEVVSAPIFGGEWAAVVVFHDLTDVKRTEQVRRDFVANVSHELRTPLASIKSVIETLAGGALDAPEAAIGFLSRADAEVDRLVRMVEELLDLSRIESGELPVGREPVDLGRVLSQAVDRLRPEAERQGLTLVLDGAADVPPVVGDAEGLERVAINLILNAVRFTPEGGSVRVAAVSECDGVRVDVTDTGAGIAPDDLPRVFERFYKTDRARGDPGTGLGLAIVRHTVEALGGAVAVESEPGRGSTFSFSLPAAPHG